MKYQKLQSMTYVICFLFFVQIPLANAEENRFYDRISISAHASADVNNDTMITTLYAQREGDELPGLADEINSLIHSAISQAKKIAEIQVKTLSYQTYPIHQKQRLIGWRVRQAIELKSENIDKLSQLIGELQNTLALESINHSVSKSQRDIVDDKLIAEAIQLFNKRAKNITQQLGRVDYRLVTLNINTNDSPIRPIRVQALPMLESRVSAPAVEPGTQEISVRVSGVIELVLN